MAKANTDYELGCLKIPQTVILAKAGILPIMEKIPACAGMTVLFDANNFDIILAKADSISDIKSTT